MPSRTRILIQQREARKMFSVIDQLKNFNERNVGTELLEVVALLVQAKAIRAEAEARNVPIPEFLDDTLRSLNRVIAERTRDARELELKEIAAEEARLLTAPEKRARLAERREKLEKELAGV